MYKEIFKITEPGVYSSVQDEGRRGFRKYGMPVSGAMDPYAFSVVNNILGNEPGLPSIEITGSCFSGIFLMDCCFTLCGADPRAEIDGKPILMNSIVYVEKGSKIKFNEMKSGMRTYLGATGGFRRKEFLGSMSMGRGERLFSGDILSSTGIIREGNKVEFDFSYIRQDGKYTIRVRKGPDSDLFSRNILKNFRKIEFVVSKFMDRMGLRLEPNENISGGPDGIVTKPVFPGCIQLTKAGIPIIIMNDGQTTGGYPVIAVVEKSDLRIIGQLKPGDSLVFRSV